MWWWICRFYDVKKGCITIDGEDLTTLDPAWLRGRVVGFINQEPVLFATTVMENIRYGFPAASDEEVSWMRWGLLFYSDYISVYVHLPMSVYCINVLFRLFKQLKQPMLMISLSHSLMVTTQWWESVVWLYQEDRNNALLLPVPFSRTQGYLCSMRPPGEARMAVSTSHVSYNILRVYKT